MTHTHYLDSTFLPGKTVSAKTNLPSRTTPPQRQNVNNTEADLIEATKVEYEKEARKKPALLKIESLVLAGNFKEAYEKYGASNIIRFLVKKFVMMGMFKKAEELILKNKRFIESKVGDADEILDILNAERITYECYRLMAANKFDDAIKLVQDSEDILEKGGRDPDKDYLSTIKGVFTRKAMLLAEKGEKDEAITLLRKLKDYGVGNKLIEAYIYMTVKMPYAEYLSGSAMTFANSGQYMRAINTIRANPNTLRKANKDPELMIKNFRSQLVEHIEDLVNKGRYDDAIKLITENNGILIEAKKDPQKLLIQVNSYKFLNFDLQILVNKGEIDLAVRKINEQRKALEPIVGNIDKFIDKLKAEHLMETAVKIDKEKGSNSALEYLTKNKEKLEAGGYTLKNAMDRIKKQNIVDESYKIFTKGNLEKAISHINTNKTLLLELGATQREIEDILNYFKANFKVAA